MGAVKKKYTIETGGDNFLVTEDEGGASVGLEFTYDNSGNKKLCVFELFPRFSTNESDFGVDIKLLHFNKLNEDDNWHFVKKEYGYVNESTFRIGNPLNSNFKEACEAGDTDAMPESKFMYKMFMDSDFNDIIVKYKIMMLMNSITGSTIEEVKGNFTTALASPELKLVIGMNDLIVETIKNKTGWTLEPIETFYKG